jgi:hypothetical protein
MDNVTRQPSSTLSEGIVDKISNLREFTVPVIPLRHRLLRRPRMGVTPFILLGFLFSLSTVEAKQFDSSVRQGFLDKSKDLWVNWNSLNDWKYSGISTNTILARETRIDGSDDLPQHIQDMAKNVTSSGQVSAIMEAVLEHYASQKRALVPIASPEATSDKVAYFSSSSFVDVVVESGVRRLVIDLKPSTPRVVGVDRMTILSGDGNVGLGGSRPGGVLVFDPLFVFRQGLGFAPPVNDQSFVEDIRSFSLAEDGSFVITESTKAPASSSNINDTIRTVRFEKLYSDLPEVPTFIQIDRSNSSHRLQWQIGYSKVARNGRAPVAIPRTIGIRSFLRTEPHGPLVENRATSFEMDLTSLAFFEKENRQTLSTLRDSAIGDMSLLPSKPGGPIESIGLHSSGLSENSASISDQSKWYSALFSGLVFTGLVILGLYIKYGRTTGYSKASTPR